MKGISILLVVAIVGFFYWQLQREKTVVANQKEEDTKLAFEETDHMIFDSLYVRLAIKMKPGQEEQNSFAGIQKSASGSYSLVFSTPGFSGQPQNLVPVQMLTNFRGIETINADIKNLGFAGSSLSLVGKPQEKKLKNFVLYQWSTMEIGSSDYYYLQNPQEPHLALKVGPMSSMLAAQTDFNWDETIWRKK